MANVVEVVIKQTGSGSAIADTSKALGGLGSAAHGVTGMLGGFGGALGNVATIAGGIVAANIFGKIVDGITGFVSTGLSAVSSSQQLEASLKALLTANNMYEQTTETVTAAVTKQVMSEEELAIATSELTAKLNTQRATYQEQQQQIIDLTAAYGDNGLNVIKARAQHEQLALSIQATEREIAGLTTTETQYTTSTKSAWQQTMDQAAAFRLASRDTQDLLGFVSKLAVVSPFETADVELTTKYAIAAGLGVDATKEFVPAFLDLAGAVGITSDSLGFAADQLFQVKKIGKLTEIDLRQLRRLGIDLAKVIGVEMGMSVEEFNKKAETSPEIFDELFDAVTRFSQNTFAGTAKEMATSVKGLQSTFHDIFVIGARTFLRPLVDAATPAVAAIATTMSDFIFGGQIESLGSDLAEMLMGGIAKFQESGAGGLFASLGFEGGALFFKKLSELMGMITGDAGTLAETIRGVLGEAFTWLTTNLFPILSQGLQFVMDHFEEFKGALIGIGAVLAGGAIAASIVSIGAVIASLVTPMGLIVAGAALLGAAWAGNWGGIQEKTFAVWAVVQPILMQLGEWLSVNLPVAIQATIDLWNNTLIPAFTQFTTFLQGTVIPAILQFAVTLQTNILTAVQMVVGFWNTSLIPAFTNTITWLTNLGASIQFVAAFWSGVFMTAITTVGNFISGTIFPLFESFANLQNAVLLKAGEALAGLWQNILLPALTAVANFVNATLTIALNALVAIIAQKLMPTIRILAAVWQDMLLPGIASVGNTIKSLVTPAFAEMGEKVDVIGPILKVFADVTLKSIEGGFSAIAGAIKSATDLFNNLADAVRNFELPDVLTPGSPPPMAIALTDISKAAGSATKEMTGLAKAVSSGNFDQFLGIDRSITQPLNVAGQAFDDLEKRLDQILGRGKANVALDIIKKIIKPNLNAVMAAANPGNMIQDLLKASGVNFERMGLTGLFSEKGGIGTAFWMDFTRHMEEAQVTLQEMFLNAGRMAVDVGQKLTGIIGGAVDMLNSRVERLQGLVAAGGGVFEGKILDAVDAQLLLNQALQDQADIQDDILKVKEQESQLNFLQQQLDLFETIKAAGLDVGDVLGGLQLGLDASIPDLIAATSAVIEAMLNQVNEDLQLASPSKVMFKKFKQVGAGMVGGLLSMTPMIERAIKPVIDPLMSIGSGANGGGASRSTNYYFNQTVNTRAEASTVIGDFNVMRGLVGA